MKNNKETLNPKRNKFLLYSTLYGGVYTLVIVIGILYGITVLKAYPEDLVAAVVFFYLVITGIVSLLCVLLNFLAWYFRLNWVAILTVVLLAVLIVLSTALIFISFTFAITWVVLIVFAFSKNEGILKND